MQITVNTKYEIGQKVYLCKSETTFKDGSFINVIVPDMNPYVITSIRVHQYTNGYFSVYYRIDGKQNSIREDQVFGSIEELKLFCYE